jgi:hypothetical protein
MTVVSYIFATALATLYVLLAVQAEPVTATLGYIAAGLLMAALIISMVKPRA